MCVPTSMADEILSPLADLLSFVEGWARSVQPYEIVVHDPHLVSVLERACTLMMSDDELYGWVEDRGLGDSTSVDRVIALVKLIARAAPHVRAVRVVTRGFLRQREASRLHAGQLLSRWAVAAAAELQPVGIELTVQLAPLLHVRRICLQGESQLLEIDHE